MKRLLYGLFVFGPLLINTPAMAHGGGGIEVDTCVINIGEYRMHFTAYQPKTLGSEELCWDIPVAGHAILVFDLIERTLRGRPVEVRIVEEQKQAGASGPGQYKTLAEKPAQLYPQGTIELETHFDSPGKYMAVVTVGGDKPLVFKTPMRVALGGNEYWKWVAVAALAVVAVAFVVWFGRRNEKKKEAAA